MNFIGNAFSLNMIESAKRGIVTDFRVTKMDRSKAIERLQETEHKSVLGHRDIANVVSEDLYMDIQFNRETIKLREGDSMIVCQYSGPRLREGSVQLPPEAQIDYFLVEMAVN